jgi:hypothetical protein
MTRWKLPDRVDGVTARRLRPARAKLPSTGRAQRSGISQWDASGKAEELAIADEAADPQHGPSCCSTPRPRVPPAVGDSPVARRGNSVIAAPHIDTAVAFGRAAGLTPPLSDLARSARRRRKAVRRSTGKTSVRAAAGFVEFGCKHGRSANASPVRNSSLTQPVPARCREDAGADEEQLTLARPLGGHHPSPPRSDFWRRSSHRQTACSNASFENGFTGRRARGR